MTTPTEAKLTLTRYGTPGCYFDDEDGQAWASFTLVHGPDIACDACGAAIRSGYGSTASGEDQYLCASCVVVVERPGRRNRRKVTRS